MTTDPYRIAVDAYCPACGVKGRLVEASESRDVGGDYDDEPYEYDFEVRTCVDCGSAHDAPRDSSVDHIKAMRIQFGRLIEGRPYEPPPPPVRDPDHKSPGLSFMEQMLKDYYGPERVKTLGPVNFGSTKIVADVSVSGKAYALDGETWAMKEGIAGIQRWIPATVTNHPGYQGTFIIPPDDEDDE